MRLEEPTPASFFILPTCFSHPPSCVPPCAAPPTTPKDLRGSANEKSTAAFLPRDKHLQVWSQSSRCLSGCFTPIGCSEVTASTAARNTPKKPSSLCLFLFHPHESAAVPTGSLQIKGRHSPVSTGFAFLSVPFCLISMQTQRGCHFSRIMQVRSSREGAPAAASLQGGGVEHENGANTTAALLL